MFEVLHHLILFCLLIFCRFRIWCFYSWKFICILYGTNFILLVNLLLALFRSNKHSSYRFTVSLTPKQRQQAKFRGILSENQNKKKNHWFESRLSGRLFCSPSHDDGRIRYEMSVCTDRFVFSFFYYHVFFFLSFFDNEKLCEMGYTYIICLLFLLC